MKIKYKKAILFSMDAFFASLLLITALLLLIDSSYIKEIDHDTISYASNDIMNAFSNIRMSELNNTYIKTLITNKIINNSGNTIIEQIGEFYVLNQSEYARNLSEELSKELIPNLYGFSIIVNEETVFDNNISVTSDLVTSRRLISGIEKFKPIKGATSKVYLSGINNKKDTTYIYFGGFLGQGNITLFNEDIPSDADFIDSEIKGAFNGNFSFYINNNLCIQINASDNILEPDSYDISSCHAHIAKGVRNNFTFISSSDLKDSYIAGGYIKISYYTNRLIYSTEEEIIDYYLADINGVINLYDSVYTPGTINSMEVFLHYISDQYTYLNIGGVNVHTSNANGTEVSLTLNNSELNSALPYTYFSNKTIPIRMASYNLTTKLSDISTADVVLITDFSGSMKKNFDTSGQGSNSYNCPDILSDYDIRRYQHAKCLDEEFIDIIFGNVSGARVWPVNLYSDTIYPYAGDPTLEGNVRNHFISVNQGKDQTCLSCALNAAYDIFLANNDSNRTRYIIMMTDGVPTHTPNGGIFSTSSNYASSETCEGYCDTTGNCVGGPYVGCSIGDNSCDDAMDSTIYALNRSINDFNVSFYGIGFGDIQTYCPNAVNLLEELANMSNKGQFNVSNDLDELKLIYQSIAYDILLVADQIAQLVNVTANFSNGRLYGDSYIQFNITPQTEQPGFGEIELTLEEDINDCVDTFEIPNEIRIVEGIVASYSGSHWTHKLFMNGYKSFSLLDYLDNDYWELGDPFRVFIPYDHILYNNTINITLADSQDNISTDCSTNNSFIYKGAISSEVSYSDVLEKVVGCNWTIEYDNGGSGNFLVPPEYSGSKKCYYTAANHIDGYDANDTYDDAMYNLMDQLDFDNDGRIFVDLTENNLIINSISILKVPYPWGPTIAEVRIWK